MLAVPLRLHELDEAVERLRRNPRTRNAVLRVDCGPCCHYDLQFVTWGGSLSAVLRVDALRVDRYHDLAWTVAEAAMVVHYCAARLRVPTERLIVAAARCRLPRWSACDRRALGLSVFLRQPRATFRRVAPVCANCLPDDLEVSGYMPMPSARGIKDLRVDSRADAAAVGRRAAAALGLVGGLV